MEHTEIIEIEEIVFLSSVTSVVSVLETATRESLVRNQRQPEALA